jgi:hypothetical protein
VPLTSPRTFCISSIDCADHFQEFRVQVPLLGLVLRLPPCQTLAHDAIQDSGDAGLLRARLRFQTPLEVRTKVPSVDDCLAHELPYSARGARDQLDYVQGLDWLPAT